MALRFLTMKTDDSVTAFRRNLERSIAGKRFLRCSARADWRKPSGSLSESCPLRTGGLAPPALALFTFQTHTITMQVQLLVANKSQKGQTLPVDVPAFRIGRAKDCHLRSTSSRISQQHCVISMHANTVTVLDLGSETGTYVNGERIFPRQELKDGDQLTVGRHSFTVSIKVGIAHACGSVFYANFSASSRASIISSMCSNPIDSRIKSGLKPVAFCSSALNCEWVVLPAKIIKLFASPTFTT